MATVMIISRTTTATVARVRGRVGIGVSPASPISQPPAEEADVQQEDHQQGSGHDEDPKQDFGAQSTAPGDHPDQEQDRCGKEQAEAGPSGVGLAQSGNRNENAAASAALGR